MKLTKADKLRIAVSKTDNDNGRGILYKTPGDGRFGDCKAALMKARIDKANRLYNVFYKLDIPRDLEGHFREVARMAANSDDVDEFCERTKKYIGFEVLNNKTGKMQLRKISWFSYKPEGSTLQAMEQHVRERMLNIWQTEENRKAAAYVLACICDGERFASKIEKMKINNRESLETFIHACQQCDKNKEQFVYIKRDTSQLELKFSLLLKTMALMVENEYSDGIKQAALEELKEGNVVEYIKGKEQIYNKEQDINIIIRQMKWLYTVDTLTEVKNKEKVEVSLERFNYPDATEERMKALLVRMRKSLKRKNNAKVAVCLLQGLAQMESTTLKKTVEELLKDEKSREELAVFIDAVNRDYHKTNIIKSVRGINVKVQPQKETNVLALSNVKNERKKVINNILTSYAASESESDQVLYDIKKVLFDYFLPGSDKVREEFLKPEKLMQIPNRSGVYFDAELKEMWGQEGTINQSRLKARIKYVNYGRYLQLRKAETEKAESNAEIRLYWLSYIKEYVEKNYVQKKGNLTREACFSTSMMLSCWKDILRFLCGKYIDIGKAVYHFTNLSDSPAKEGGAVYGTIREEYQDGISSFSYEAIKAEETLQRDIANVTVSAAAAFSRAVVDSEKQRSCKQENTEDIFFLQEKQLDMFLHENAKNRLLRFFGGASVVKNAADIHDRKLVSEILEQLKAVRNENLHYGAEKETNIRYEQTDKLWENDVNEYQQLVRHRFYVNNVGMFYDCKDIKNLVNKIYSDEKISEAQIPAFQTVFKKKDLPECFILDEKDISEEREMKYIRLPEGLDEKKRVIYEGALYFLLKEIYYCDFIVNENAAELFFEAVYDNKEKYVNLQKKDRETKQLANSGDDFAWYVEGLKKKYKNCELSFGGVCQSIINEYNQQNSGKQEKEIYKHFKTLLAFCMKNAFWKYVGEHYKFLFTPKLFETKEELKYLDDAEIYCGFSKKEERTQTDYIWYTFAHFLHPRQLNFLIGDFKSYIQYREDIFRRSGYAGQPMEDKADTNSAVKKAKNILRVLEFVRGVSGRVSNKFTDYYGNEEEFASYLSQYIDFSQGVGNTSFLKLKDFCENMLDNDAIIDLYADEKNPKVIRNIELARMYAGGDICLPEYTKISPEEIREYYDTKDNIALIMSKGECDNKEEQGRVVRFQQLKNRITLNEVTDIYALINDLLGKLVSFSYLRERDEMYLLLGFYYMALCDNWESDKWQGEELNAVTSGSYNVRQGLVLYQVAGIFDFRTGLLCYDGEKWMKQRGQTSLKINRFFKNHKKSMEKAVRLFEARKYDREINNLRNYVDHSKYYTNPNRSIIELYSEYYTKFFGYSSKLRKSVLFNFQSVLERYFMEGSVLFANDACCKIELTELKSQKFTYRLKDDGKHNVTVEFDARDKSFLDEVKKTLEWKQMG